MKNNMSLKRAIFLPICCIGMMRRQLRVPSC
jgi:hypothetical protein